MKWWVEEAEADSTWPCVITTNAEGRMEVVAIEYNPQINTGLEVAIEIEALVGLSEVIRVLVMDAPI